MLRARIDRFVSTMWRLLRDCRGVSGRTGQAILVIAAASLGGKAAIERVTQSMEASGEIAGDAVDTAECVARGGTDCISVGDPQMSLPPPPVLVAQTYCNTVIGTQIIVCGSLYKEMHPTARAIIDAHEKVHTRQNPLTPHDCREVPAYQVQGRMASRWLQNRCSTYHKTKEGRDVNLLCLEANENGAKMCSNCKSCRGWADVRCCI
jgi:hypothetical protein